MTVSSQTSSETFNGNGVTTVWDLPFRFFNNSDVFVYLVDPLVPTSTLLALGTDYTLTGAGLPEQFGNAPGQITTTVAVANGKELFVERVMEAEQLTDIVNQGKFFPEVHEDVFDGLTMLIQQGFSSNQRALRVQDFDPIPSKIPAVAARAGRLLSFDDAGNPITAAFPTESAAGLAARLADSVNPLNGSAAIGHRGRDLRAKLDDTVYVTDDHGAPLGGAKGDGVTDDYAAIMAAFTFANLTGRKTVIFPNPTVSYAVGQMLQIPIVDNMRIIGVGFPTIKYIGAGAVLAVVSLDQSISAGRYGIGFENFNIQGNANVQEGLYMRAISHSTIRNVRAWNTVHSGIRINSGVCNTYDNIRVTSVGGIAGAPAVVPAEGIVLDQQGVGDYVAWCSFLNPIAENITANGLRLNSATGCIFTGGTSEGNVRGVFIGVGCNYNRFVNVDYEVNGVNSDMVINGAGNIIDNNQSLSFAATYNYDVQAAEGTIFLGGNARSVRLQSTSKDTKFFGTRFSDNGALGITGTGTYQQYGCVREDNAGLISVSMPDKIIRLGVGASIGLSTAALHAQGLGSTSATDCFNFLAGGSGTVLMRGRNDGTVFSPAAYALTTASPANLFIGSDGSLARSTSALKYKDVKGPIPREMIDKVLGLSGFLYQQKHGGDGARLFVGMAADDFDADGLRCLVNFGEDGEVEGLHYERLIVVLLEELKALRGRVAELEDIKPHGTDLASLLARVEALEASAPAPNPE